MDLQRDSQAQRPNKTAKPPHGGFFTFLRWMGRPLFARSGPSTQVACSLSAVSSTDGRNILIEPFWHANCLEESELVHVAMSQVNLCLWNALRNGFVFLQFSIHLLNF